MNKTIIKKYYIMLLNFFSQKSEAIMGKEKLQPRIKKGVKEEGDRRGEDGLKPIMRVI